MHPQRQGSNNCRAPQTRCRKTRALKLSSARPCYKRVWGPFWTSAFFEKPSSTRNTYRSIRVLLRYIIRLGLLHIYLYACIHVYTYNSIRRLGPLFENALQPIAKVTRAMSRLFGIRGIACCGFSRIRGARDCKSRCFATSRKGQLCIFRNAAFGTISGNKNNASAGYAQGVLKRQASVANSSGKRRSDHLGTMPGEGAGASSGIRPLPSAVFARIGALAFNAELARRTSRKRGRQEAARPRCAATASIAPRQSVSLVN